MDTNARFIELETRIAYQDHTIETFNGVLLEMREEIDALRRELKEVKSKAESGSPDFGPANDKPPHW